MNLSEKLKHLPSSPGVYLMKDSLGHILYVGKSKNLKNRVQSYFQNAKAHSPKVRKLVQHLKDFDLIQTDTEFEAFMLECRLIKDIKPMYNRKMKSPLNYTFLVIESVGGQRRLGTTNRFEARPGVEHFGPYPSRSTVERAVQGLMACFRIDCSDPSPRHNACLNHSLGLCMGMCLGGMAAEQYHAILDQVAALLNGSDTSLLEEMERRMQEASEAFDFEAAAKHRDSLNAVRALVNKEKVIGFAEENRNIAVLESLGETRMKLFLIKRSSVLHSESIAVNPLDPSSVEQQILRIRGTILDWFASAGPSLPSSPVRQEELDEAQIIYSYLKTSSCKSAVIPHDWLEASNSSAIDTAVRELLFDYIGYSYPCVSPR